MHMQCILSVCILFLFKKENTNLHPVRDSNSIPQRYLFPGCASLPIAPQGILASVDLRKLSNSLLSHLACIVYIPGVFCSSIHSNICLSYFYGNFCLRIICLGSVGIPSD